MIKSLQTQSKIIIHYKDAYTNTTQQHIRIAMNTYPIHHNGQMNAQPPSSIIIAPITSVTTNRNKLSQCSSKPQSITIDCHLIYCHHHILN